jgi:hypothetical protein
MSVSTLENRTKNAAPFKTTARECSFRLLSLEHKLTCLRILFDDRSLVSFIRGR